jgi:hypothetical protein
MPNKPNSKTNKMTLTSYFLRTTNYDPRTAKPKNKPNQTQLCSKSFL